MPAIPRKSPEEWESVKNLIREYFIVQNETLNKTMVYMERQHSFTATQKEYRRRLEQWGMRKNLPKGTWQDIDGMKANGKRTIRGIAVSSKRLKRSITRYGAGNHRTFEPGDDSCDIPWFYFEERTHNYLRSKMESIIPQLPWINPPGTPIHLFSPAELSISSAKDLLQSFFRDTITVETHDASAQVVEHLKNYMPRKLSTESELISVEPFFLLTQTCIYLVSNALLGDRMMNRFLHWVCEIGAVLRLNMFIDKLVNKLQENPNATSEIFLFHLLRSAVSLELEALVHALLKKGVSPNQSCSKSAMDHCHSDSPVGSYNTPLQIAVLRGNTRICRILLSYNADVNATSQLQNMPPLFIAVSGHGNLEIANILVNHGSDVNCWSDGDFNESRSVYVGFMASNRSVLMEAVDRQHLGITQLLLEHGASINEVSNQLGSALQIAVRKGDVKMVELLVEKGAHFDLVEALEDSLVTFVAGNLRALFVHSTNLKSVLEYFEKEIKAVAVSMPLRIAAYRNDSDMVKFLLSIGVKANHQRPDWDRIWSRVLELDSVQSGLELNYDHYLSLKTLLRRSESALHAAVENGNVEMTKCLLEAGAIVDDTDAYGATALQVSCGLRKIQMEVEEDYANSDDEEDFGVETQDFRKSSATISTSDSSIALVELLLDWKADINFPAGTSQGRTALQSAAQLANEDLVTFLLSRDADVNAPAGPDDGLTAVEAAALTGKSALVAQLVTAGATPSPTIDSITLHIAARKGFECDVDDLLRRNVDVHTTLMNQSDPELKGTVLQAAIRGRHPRIIRKLLEHGVDLNAIIEEETALCTAVREAAPNILKMLLEEGANPNIQGVRVTPLALAASVRSMAMVDILLNADADVNQLSYWHHFGHGRSAKVLGWALLSWVPKDRSGLDQFHEIVIVSRLLKHGADPDEADSQLEYPIKIIAKLQAGDLMTILLKKGVDVDAHLYNPGPEWAFTDWGFVPIRGAALADKSEQITRNIIRASKKSLDRSVLLTLAVKSKYFGWAEELLNESPNVNSTCESGSALAWACLYGHVKLAEKLLAEGADMFCSLPNGIEFWGFASLLQMATAKGDFNIVRLLLNHGAKDHETNGIHNTALQKAAQFGRLDVAFLLLQNDDKSDTLQSRCIDAAKQAARFGHRILAQKLREHVS